MQKRLFTAIPGVNFLGKRYDRPDSAWLGEMRDELTKSHCFDFAPEKVRAIANNHSGPPDGRLWIFSNEASYGAAVSIPNATLIG